MEETTSLRQFNIPALKSLFDELIDRHAELYLSVYPEIKEFSNFERSGTVNYYIGMVCTNDFEKPDTTQLYIRGSLTMTRNKLLELDLSSIDCQQTFFPGQIVAFAADPFLKRQLTVRKILDPMRIAPPLKKIDTDDRKKLIIASGPYMKPEKEDWTLIDKLVENIEAHEATHVVLIGPFVDVDNKHAQANFDAHWKSVLARLIDRLVNQQCHIYLVPSGKDILWSNMLPSYFYPTPKTSIDIKLKPDVQPKCTIETVTDPAQIDLGGIYLDVTSAEVLFHLNKCTSFVKKSSGNSFTPLFRHILSQGIYPIYPPPSDIAIDYPKLAKHIRPDRLGPHILILPSRFNTTVGNVENRLVVTINRCSIKKHVVVIDIPKIESTPEAPVDSITLTEWRHTIVDLVPKEEIKEEQQSSSEPTQSSNTEITVGST